MCWRVDTQLSEEKKYGRVYLSQKFNCIRVTNKICNKWSITFFDSVNTKNYHLLYLLTQIGGKYVMSVVSWVTKLNNSQGWKQILNSLGKQQVEFLTCMLSGCAPWNHGEFLPASINHKTFIFNDWPHGKLSPFCRPLTLSVPLGFISGSIEGLRKQKAHCFLIPSMFFTALFRQIHFIKCTYLH